MIREVIVYETSDGERFNTREAAEEHNFSAKWKDLTEHDVVIKGHEGRTESFEYWYHSFEEAYYVEVKTSLGQNFIEAICEKNYLDSFLDRKQPFTRYRWDEVLEDWVSFKKDYEYFCERWEKYK